MALDSLLYILGGERRQCFRRNRVGEGFLGMNKFGSGFVSMNGEWSEIGGVCHPYYQGVSVDRFNINVGNGVALSRDILT